MHRCFPGASSAIVETNGLLASGYGTGWGESQLYVCAGHDYLRPSAGDIIVLRLLGSPAGHRFFSLPGEGAIEIVDAPTGRLPVSELMHSRLRLRSEAGHAYILQLAPNPRFSKLTRFD